MADRMALFKAAKAQRKTAGSVLSKEQIKALKQQKAQAEAEAQAAAAQDAERQQKHEAALAGARAAMARAGAPPGMPPPAPKTTASAAMPPPPPRPAHLSKANGSIGSTPGAPVRLTDSQVKQRGRGASIAPEPAGQSNASSGAVRPPTEPMASMRPSSEERSISSLPADFYDDAGVGNGQESVGTGELMGSTLDPQSEVASARGNSTAGISRGVSGESTAAVSSVSALPADFFEAGASNELQAAPKPATIPEVPEEAPGPIPKGFFENKEADAKARGVALPKKKTVEEEYTDFMSAIAEDVKEVETREQEEAVETAQERADREAFEQRMRLERIKALKEGGASVAMQAIPTADEVQEIDLAAVVPSRKRRRAGENSDNSDDSEDGDDEDELIDWRAKGM